MKYFITILALMVGCALQAQWYQVNSNTSENLHDIFFVDSLAGYCVGGGDEYGLNNEGNGVVLETTDGGENWDVIFSQDSLSIQHVAVVSENGYTKLYGFAMKSGTPYLVSTFLSSQFQNWNVQPIPYNPVHVKISQNKILFIDNIDSHLKMIENNTVVNVGGPSALFGLSEENLVRMNITIDSLFISQNLADSWNAWQSFPSTFGANQGNHAEINFINDTLILKGTYPGQVNYSTNDGTSWITNGGAPNFKSTIVNAHTIYGMDNLNRVLVTTDIGETWQIQDSLGVNIYRLYFYNEAMGFAVGEEGEIFKTTNSGGITSTQEVDDLKKKIKVFPNPSSGKLELEIDNHLHVYGLNIVNQTGQSVEKYPSGQNKIDLSRFPDGVYFIKFLTDKGPHTEKVVIRK